MNAVPEHVEDIVRAAVAAPSGDNSQPWRFVFRAPDKLEFHAMPEKDHQLFNVDDSGTLVALGAAIQNAELEAKALGFEPEIHYESRDTHIATFVLRDGEMLSEKERGFQRAIPLRHTNRKAYKKTPLVEDDRRAMLDAAQNANGASLSLVEDEKSMNLISRALTTMEETALQNRTLHELFFQSIFWSKERNAAGGCGLYIRTLELPPPARLLFRFLRYWPVASALARIGFPNIVAETNAKQNASASAFGIITVDRFSRANYIEAGRLLERIWLAATARGMSLQIVTGLLFLARALERGSSEIFSVSECESVRSAYAQVRGNIGTSSEPFLAFRIGYSAAPTAVSFRKLPAIAYAD